jgi:hypothetical protein
MRSCARRTGRGHAHKGLSLGLSLVLVAVVSLVGAIFASNVASPRAFAFTDNTGQPAVAINPTNNFQWVFWRNNGNGHIYEAWYSGKWNGPVDMGWASTSAPSVAVDDNSNQWVFWRGDDGNIWEAWYVSGQGWNGPVDQGWPTASAPSVAVNPTNQWQYVFWQGNDGNLWGAWYYGSWSTHDFVGWTTTSAPSVGEDSAGNQWVFYRGTDGNLWEVWGVYNVGWYGPADFTNVPINSQPSLALNPSNDLQWVFYQGSDGNLWEVWYQNGWYGPADFGSGWGLTSAPSAAADTSNYQWVFWLGTNGDIWEAWYQGNWNGPVDVLPLSPDPPQALPSYYYQDLGTQNDGYIESYDQGCAYGQNGLSGLQVLDFGRVAYDASSDQFGTILKNQSGFTSNSSIFAALFEWTAGWANCRTSEAQTLTLVIGANDSFDMGTCMPSPLTPNGCTYSPPASHSDPNGAVSSGTYAAGAWWNDWVNGLEQQLVQYGRNGVIFPAGGLDAEPAWDPNLGGQGSMCPQGGCWTNDTEQWSLGWNANMNGQYQLWDFGTAEGGWVPNNQDLYNVAFGNADNFVTPEIYNCCVQGTISDWITGYYGGPGLDSWAKSTGQWFEVNGVTTDYNAANGACLQLPSQLWLDTLSAIQGDAQTYPQTSVGYLNNFAC